MEERSRICIVTSRNIFDSPCIEKYKKLIKEDYDILYWDHVGIEEECGAKNYFKFDGQMGVGASPVKKIWMYLKYIRFLKSFIKKSDYDKLIVYPNQVAWFLNKYLKKKYKGKYLLDIRDHVWSDRRIPGKLMADAVNNSGLCSLTSPAFAKYLPKHDYIISHNIQPIDQALIDSYRKRDFNHTPITLSFIGTVRFISEQKKVIRAFANDDRFVLKFIGRGSEQLKSFCEENAITNVELVGQFPREKLGEYYMDADFAMNVYGNEQITLQLALSNKLYSAAMMGMPILCSPNTYMAEISEQYGFGVSVDPTDPQCKEKVFEFFRNIDKEKMQAHCDEFMNNVEKDEAEYTKRVNEFINCQDFACE